MSALQQPSLGILNYQGAQHKFLLNRYAPSEDIAFFVKHYWIVSWDLTGQAPHSQDIVPNPCVNLVVERIKTAIYGPAKTKYSHLVQNKGCVFGVKFRPGGFYPFIQRAVSELSLHPQGIPNLFDTEEPTMEERILAQTEDRKMVELAEQYIRRKLPQPDDSVTLINRIIDRVVEDREITRVEHIVQAFQINTRKLQRLFSQYVGVNPKWVIQLYRIHNAAETIDKGEPIDWSKLSAELGYYDQAHFIKDFKAIIGNTPEEYTRKHM